MRGPGRALSSQMMMRVLLPCCGGGWERVSLVPFKRVSVRLLVRLPAEGLRAEN